MKKLTSLLLLLMTLTLCLTGSAAASSAVYQLGDKIDDFTVTTYDGRTVTLSEVLEEKEAVLINIWATWCGPCRMIAPALAEIAAENTGRLKVGKVNVDEEMELAVQFSVASIPTLVVMHNGAVAAKTVGYCPKEEIEAMLG